MSRPTTPAPRTVHVPGERLARWVGGFEERHGTVRAVLVPRGAGPPGDGARWVLVASDGARAELVPPFGRAVAASGGPGPDPGAADGAVGLAGVVEALVTACRPPEDWGLLLVRRGAHAVGRVRGSEVVATSTGTRLVQGRTKAGGQSQQRYARRRANQARDSWRSAAERAARVLASPPVDLLVVGGDAEGVRAVLDHPAAAGLAERVAGSRLAVPEPRAATLHAAATTARSARIVLVEPG